MEEAIVGSNITITITIKTRHDEERGGAWRDPTSPCEIAPGRNAGFDRADICWRHPKRSGLIQEE